MDLIEIIDKLLDYTGITEDRQNYGEACVRLEILAVYQGLRAGSKDEEAAKVKDFAMKYLGMLEDDFSLFVEK